MPTEVLGRLSNIFKLFAALDLLGPVIIMYVLDYLCSSGFTPTAKPDYVYVPLCYNSKLALLLDIVSPCIEEVVYLIPPSILSALVVVESYTARVLLFTIFFYLLDTARVFERKAFLDFIAIILLLTYGLGGSGYTSAFYV